VASEAARRGLVADVVRIGRGRDPHLGGGHEPVDGLEARDRRIDARALVPGDERIPLFVERAEALDGQVRVHFGGVLRRKPITASRLTYGRSRLTVPPSSPSSIAWPRSGMAWPTRLWQSMQSIRRRRPVSRSRSMSGPTAFDIVTALEAMYSSRSPPSRLMTT
jgi:hypothetical protein